MPEKHLPFGGSTIARYMNCPGSFKLIKSLPPAPASEAADRGSLLHHVMEYLIKHDKQPTDLSPGQFEYNGIGLTQDHIDEEITTAFKSITALIESLDIPKSKKVVEPFVQMKTDKIGGSIDFFGVSSDGKTAVIADYKFGYTKVDPSSPQLLFYALCADFDDQTAPLMEGINEIVVAIIQPANEESPVSTLTYSIDELDSFEQKVIDAVAAAESDNAPLKTGDQCRFCPAQAICPQKTGQALAALQMGSNAINSLTEALKLATELEPWIKAVKKTAHEQLELGTQIPGWKLVAKRAVKRWTDDLAGLRKAISGTRGISIKEAYVEVPLTPTQLLKLFEKKGLDSSRIMGYVSATSSGTTLAPTSDKRAEAPASAALKMMANM
jgi:hypothetical protein